MFGHHSSVATPTYGRVDSDDRDATETTTTSAVMPGRCIAGRAQVAPVVAVARRLSIQPYAPTLSRVISCGRQPCRHRQGKGLRREVAPKNLLDLGQPPASASAFLRECHSPRTSCTSVNYSPFFALPLENAPGSWTVASFVPGEAQIGSICIGPEFRNFAPDLEGLLVATFRLNFISCTTGLNLLWEKIVRRQTLHTTVTYSVIYR